MTKRDMKVLLNHVFNLGQIYWQQTNSESYTDNKKSDVTLAKFREIVERSCEGLEE